MDAQFIIAGQYTTNDYFHDVVPDSVYKAVGSSLPAMVTKPLDVNGDGIIDFDLVSYKGGGSGNPQRSAYITPKNNNQILMQDTAVCTYTNGSPLCCGTITVMAAKPTILGDSIKNRGKWYNNTQYLYEINYCNVGYFALNNFIGVRVFNGSDTLYGWIKVAFTAPSGYAAITLYEFACNRSCQAAPSITVATTSTLICSGETSTISASGASSYTWSTMSNGNSIIVSPTVTTSYTVDGVSAGCPVSAVITQSVDACIGIKEYEQNFSIGVKPNPTNGQVEFTLNRPVSDINIRLINSLGQIILEDKKANSNKFAFDISNYSNGVYYVEIESSHGISRTKFVKD